MIDHNDSVIAPMKGAEKEVKANLNATVPVKLTTGTTDIIGIRCPIDWRIVIPAPVTVYGAWVVIRHINNLFLYWLYHYLVVNSGDGHVFHFRQAISLVGLCSERLNTGEQFHLILKEGIA